MDSRRLRKSRHTGRLCEFQFNAEIDTTISLEHKPENAPDFRIDDYALTHYEYNRNELPDLAAYIQRYYPGDTVIEEWLTELVATGVKSAGNC